MDDSGDMCEHCGYWFDDDELDEDYLCAGCAEGVAIVRGDDG